MVTGFVMLFSTFAVMPVQKVNAAVTYGTRITVTRAAQVVDSITYNGATVNAIYAPRNNIKNYDSDKNYCCAAFVSRFYEQAFDIGINNLSPDSSKPKPNIYYGSGSFSLTKTPKVGDIAANSHHWAIVKKVSGNEITLVEQNVWTDNYTKALVDNKIVMPESGYWFWHYSLNTGHAIDDDEAHKFSHTTVKPTYFADGYTEHKCSGCGYVYRDKYTDQLKLGVVSGFNSSKVTDNTATLSWNSVSGADGYIVYLKKSGSWVRIYKNKKNYLDLKNLSSSAQYQYAVKAYKTVSGREVTSPSYPTTQVVVKPGAVSGLKVNGYTTNSVKLSWDKTQGADGYVVYRYDSAKKNWVRLAKLTGTSYTATKLLSGTSYKFAVKTYNTVDGKEVGGAKLSQVFTGTNPDKVNFTVKSPGKGTAAFNWSKVRGASGYIVYYKANAKDSWHRLTVTNSTSFTKKGLTSGHNYTFTVKAYRKNAAGTVFNGAFTTKNLKLK